MIPVQHLFCLPVVCEHVRPTVGFLALFCPALTNLSHYYYDQYYYYYCSVADFRLFMNPNL